MTRRFSAAELRFFRNRIPIKKVIETLPGLHSQEKNGKLSFACPICGGIETSINAPHNLARCFACQQNFNPVELVMHQLNIGFVNSIKWLKNNMSAMPDYPETYASNVDNAQPTAIGDILSEVMSLPHMKTDAQHLESIIDRITRLEHQVRNLYSTLNKLQSSPHQ